MLFINHVLEFKYKPSHLRYDENLFLYIYISFNFKQSA